MKANQQLKCLNINTNRNQSHQQNGKLKSPKIRKRKRCFDPTEKLPTPPPDPHEIDKVVGERYPKRKSLEENKKKIIQNVDYSQSSENRYINAHAISDSRAVFSTIFFNANEAFQYLDKLYFLVGQILELREKNSKLFRRVRELERLKALRLSESVTKQIFMQTDLEPLISDEEIGFAESLLSTILQSSTYPYNNQPSSGPTTPNQEIMRNRSFKTLPITRQRSRFIDTDSRNFHLNFSKRESYHLQSNSAERMITLHSNGTVLPKVSKWTKVKAAFKWERAGIGTSSNLILESIENDTSTLLRQSESPESITMTNTSIATTIIRSRHSPNNLEYSSPPSPGTSSSSSMDDVYLSLHKKMHMKSNIRQIEESPIGRSSSLENELNIPQNVEYDMQHLRDGFNRKLVKGHKTPWGMIKDIIQFRRDNVRRSLPHDNILSEDGHSLSNFESSEMLHETVTPNFTTEPHVQITVSEGSLTIASSKSSGTGNSSDIVDLSSCCLTPTLTITVPSVEELTNISSLESVASPMFHRHLDFNWTDELLSKEPESTCSSKYRDLASMSLTEWKISATARGISRGKNHYLPQLQRQNSKWNKVKRAFLMSASSVPPSPSRMSTFFEGKTHLSEDFLKKMEEWKKIKSNMCSDEQINSDRRDSIDMVYQINDMNQRWKILDEKEFQPLNKVIEMMEREQRMFEKYTDKLHNKTSRVIKLSHINDSTPIKRELLVQTSTGFYRFEGISQEFTRKLYEWEKSQGIAPEYSTLQLLNPAYRIFLSDKSSESILDKDVKILTRSKSMTTVIENNLRNKNSNLQHSSLSLNDIADLENKASKQMIIDEEMSDVLALDDSEPEAVIVDIEDVIEETATPMAKLQLQQTPVYCVTTNENTSIAIPLGTVTADYEPSPVILIHAEQTHRNIQKKCQDPQLHNKKIQIDNMIEINLNNKQTISQIDFSKNDISNDEIRKKIFKLNEISICKTIIEEEVSSSHIENEANTNSKILNDMKSIRKSEIKSNEDKKLSVDVVINIPNQKNYINQITRTPIISQNNQVKIINTGCLGLSDDIEKKDYKTLLMLRREKLEDEKSNTVVQNNEHAVQCHRPKESNSRTDNNDNAIITVSSDIRQKKVLKTRRLTDTQVGYKWQQSPHEIAESSIKANESLTVSNYTEIPSIERIIINESTLNKIIVPTASNEKITNMATSSKKVKNNIINEGELYCKRVNNKTKSDSVFIRTKRIIFSPFSRRNYKDKTVLSNLQVEKSESFEKNKEFIHYSALSSKCNLPIEPAKKCSNIQRSKLSFEYPITYDKRSFLPQSPILSRKEYRCLSPKETTPGIRMMIQRYNQKLQKDARSPVSSGSGSPIWISPISERRVKTQMRKYQKEIRRTISDSLKNDVKENKKQLEKCASTGIMQPILESLSTRNVKSEIHKSVSAEFMRKSDFVNQNMNKSTINTPINIKNTFKNVENNTTFFEKRKNSIQNTNSEICTNIKQCLVQNYKTVLIQNEKAEDKNINDVEENNYSVCKKTLKCTYENNRTKNENDIKISRKDLPELINKINVLANATTHKHERFYIKSENYEVITSEISTPLRIRAQRLKKAKDDFFSCNPNCYSYDPSIKSYRHRQKSSVSIDLDNTSNFIKSASAGMINVDSRTFERLATQSNDSLLRIDKSCPEVAGTLNKIASKFWRVKLKEGKHKDEKMSTVSMLCRQSLMVDIKTEEISKSCPTSPLPQRDEDDYLRFKQHINNN